MRNRIAVVAGVVMAMGALFWAGAAAASDVSPRCASAVDKAAGHYSRCLLNAEAKFARNGDETRLEDRAQWCENKFYRRINRTNNKFGAENCPEIGLANAIVQELAMTAAQVANDAEDEPGCGADVNAPCVRGKVSGVGTCCGQNVCVQDPNDLTGDAGICVPAGAGGTRRPDLCYTDHAQTASDFCDATWVFCIDAVCSEPMWTDDGYQIAQCTCWEQEKAISWLPKGDTVGQGGAPCLMHYSAGKSMCDDMKNGALVSTFRPGDSSNPIPGPPSQEQVILEEIAVKFPDTPIEELLSGNTSYIPTPSSTTCPATTLWAYCWGAKCQTCEEAGVEGCVGNEVICDCPVASVSPHYTNQADGSPVPQPIYIPESQCGSAAEACNTIYNGQPATLNSKTKVPVTIEPNCG